MSKNGVFQSTVFTESYTFTGLSEATAYTLGVQSGLNSLGTIAWGGAARKRCSTEQSVCIWYTEPPYAVLARHDRVNGSCPAIPVVPHSTAATACANGGAWRYTGNDGTGWWYVSVCAPATPSGLLCPATTTTIEFSWGSVTGADRYRVSKDGGNTWVQPSPATGTSHTFKGLAAGTSYALSVQAGVDDENTTAWSPAANKSCPTDALPQTSAVPTELECAATATTIELSWTAAAGADRYQVSSDGGRTWDEADPIDATSHVFTGLSADSLYALSVQAGVDNRDGTTWSAASNWICNTAITSRPTGLECAARATSIEFSWDAVDGADTYTAIATPPTSGSTKHRAERITDTSATFIGLDPSTNYFLSVFAVDGGLQKLPAGKRCTTSAAAANPGRPVCSAATDNSITLRWNSETGVHQWYAARVTTGSSFTDGRPLGSTTLTRQFTGLASNTTYKFYFWWKSSTGPWVQLKPDVLCTTTGPGTSPAPPTCATATADSITLTWDKDTGVNQWHISRATVPDTARATVNDTQLAGQTLSSSTLSATFTDLSPSTAYTFWFWWRPSATANWNEIDPHATCATTALAFAPTPPICGTATRNSVQLNWSANTLAHRWHLARPGNASALIDSKLLEAQTLTTDFAGLSPSTSYTFLLWWRTSSTSDWYQITPDRSCTTQAATTTPVRTTCQTTGTYCVTRGVYDAVVRAARKATTSPTGAVCTQAQLTTSGRSQITPNMLASMMLAIPAWELNGGNTNRALSPLTLSRGDNMVNRTSDSNNIQLYSHMTLDGYKRAHWNPGVGLWQIDNFTESNAQVDALRYGHAERADVDKGGYEVAKYIRYRYCRGMNPFNRWVACSSSRCLTTHNARYSSATDRIQAETVEGLTDPTGGIQQRLCRWGTTGPKMACYIYDLSLREGHVQNTCCPPGTTYSDPYTVNYNPYTPEAAPFISFTDTDTYTGKSTKYAVWPKEWPASSGGLSWPTPTSAGVGEATKTIIRAVRAAEEARFSPYNDDSNPARKGIAHHGLTKLATETVAEYEARIEDKIEEFNGGPLTVNNSADNYGLSTGSAGPEGWFDSLVNSRDLQIYNCPGTIGDTLTEACWVGINTASTSGSN